MNYTQQRRIEQITENTRWCQVDVGKNSIPRSCRYVIKSLLLPDAVQLWGRLDMGPHGGCFHGSRHGAHNDAFLWG